MKRLSIFLLFIITISLSACSNQGSKDTLNIENNNSEEIDMKNTEKQEDIINKDDPADEALIENNDTEDTASQTTDPADLTEDDSDTTAKETPFTVSDSIPQEYLIFRPDQSGSIQHISYQTQDYFGDNSEITKYAYVYLPYDYDESKKYNVLYLMHGIGGNEKEWGMYNEISQVKIMMDNLIANGEIEPFIIVTPNGRSSINFADTSSNHNSFYLFGQELRNDLIPYIESNFSTYGEYDANGYDLSAARDHRAMAGLSMGGMQTINIGLCETLDALSYFGSFSSAPTTYTSTKIASILKNYPDYDIHYFYNICGTEDGIAIASSSAAVSSLTSLTDKLNDGENFIWQQVRGAHDFKVWYLGFYNFARIVFR